MREGPAKANPLDPLMAAFQPRRVIRFGCRAHIKSGPHGDFDPPPNDSVPARQMM